MLMCGCALLRCLLFLAEAFHASSLSGSFMRDKERPPSHCFNGGLLFSPLCKCRILILNTDMPQNLHADIPDSQRTGGRELLRHSQWMLKPKMISAALLLRLPVLQNYTTFVLVSALQVNSLPALCGLEEDGFLRTVC